MSKPHIEQLREWANQGMTCSIGVSEHGGLVRLDESIGGHVVASAEAPTYAMAAALLWGRDE